MQKATMNTSPTAKEIIGYEYSEILGKKVPIPEKFTKGETVVITRKFNSGDYEIASLDGKKTGWVADFEITLIK